MKHVTLFLSILALLFTSATCQSQENKKGVDQALNSPKVSVYYFHFTQRCATCKAVEENARNAVEALYPGEVKAGEYSFSALNLDDEDSRKIADKLGVGGQTLLVVCGDKKVDITSSGFLNAHDPEKMQQEIKSAVDKVLD